MQLHIRDIPLQVAIAYAAKTNLLIVGQPGIGKSMQVYECVKKLRERVENFGYWPMDCPTMTPTDIGTFMPNMKTGMLDYFPNGTLPNAYVTPDAVGIVFQGEVLNTDPTSLKTLQKYDNGEDINGRLRKPEGVIVVADANRLVDKSGVLQQSRAFMNRFEQIEAYGDAKGNIEYAEKMDFHHTVQTFLKEWPDLIDNYDDVFINPNKATKKGNSGELSVLAEEGKRGIWASMRGWDRLSRLEYTCESMKAELMPQRIIGNVGTGIGLQYNTHRSMIGKLATVEQIVTDPKHAPVPSKADELYAQLVMLAMKVEVKSMRSVDIYLDRVDGDLKAMCINRMLKRATKHHGTFNLSATKEYQKWMADKQFVDLLMAR